MKPVKLALVVCAFLAAGCATSFSGPSVRAEIVRQTGQDPKSVFELNVGRVTMALAKRLIGPQGSADGSLPLSGLTSFELGVYGLQATGPSGARPLDFSAMPVKGWEPTLRFREGARSGVVLVRASGDSVGDLVLLAADEDSALYARLRGTLPKELPDALGKAVSTGGTDAVKKQLESLGQEN